MPANAVSRRQLHHATGHDRRCRVGISGNDLGAVFGTQSVMISRVRNADRASKRTQRRLQGSLFGADKATPNLQTDRLQPRSKNFLRFVRTPL